MDQVDEVKQKTDIVAIIGEHVRLTKAGRNFKGLCPFHEEKSPSFMVSSELQIYKCFGCGESGDVFTFLERYEGMEFYEALKYLADRVGVKLKPISGQDTSLKAQLIETNELAARFYNYLLLSPQYGKVGLEYLTEKRGLTPATIKEFNIGFSPDKPDILFQFLANKKKINRNVIEQAGLVFKTQRGYMDRFRGRVIFPIANHRGEIIALAGRILPQFDTGKMGKYINSPETPIYHKSSSLYGLNVTKNDIRSAKAAIVVEGELDFLSSWQAGIKNVVAIKGTALTAEHVRVLARFAEVITMALDSDFAGDTAAIRGLSLAQNAGLEIKVVEIVDYKDPDEFARADPDGFKIAIRSAVDAWEFIIDVVAKRFDLNSGAGKSKASRQLVPVLASIEDNIVRSHYLQKAALRLGVPIEAVVKEVEKQTKQPAASAPQEEGIQINTAKTRRELLEERLLILFLEKPILVDLDEMEKLVITNLASKMTLKLKDYFSKNEMFDAAVFSSQLPDELRSAFADILMKSSEENTGSTEKEMDIIKNEIRKMILEEEHMELAKKISEAEARGDEENLLKFQKRYDEVSNEQKELSNKTIA